jgi:DNA replication and repair protein RecF
MVQVWDPSLTESGSVILEERRRWIRRWRDPFSDYYRRVSGSRTASMAYRPGVRLEGTDRRQEIVEAFQVGLEESRDRELRLGNTVVGPHRDDLLLTVEEESGDRDLREFGSGGQRRTAALALRLVEAATIRMARRQEPIVLMDDVFAELDPGRSERILGLMEEEETGQVLLTVPKESDVRFRRETLPRWTISGGRVEK